MELWGAVALLLLVMLGLMAIGLPVAFTMFISGIIGLVAFLGPHYISALKAILWATPKDLILVAVPLYLFMGEILLRIGISGRLYSGLAPWLERLPGGLLHANIGACAVFAAVSGSSPATAAAIGSIAIPEMDKRHYPPRLTVGSLAAGGTLGILIPPSIAMIVYGALVGESVGQLFIAGIIPGIIEALLYMLYIAVWALLNPKLIPVSPRQRWKTMFSGLTGLVPFGILMFLVLGTIYLGVATPTEAAAIGVTGSLILGLAYRVLNWQIVRDSLIEATRLTCSIILIFVGAKVVSLVFGSLGLPMALADFVVTRSMPPLLVLSAVSLIYIIEGCFLDPASINMLTLPIVYPMVMALGFDSVWFGVVVVVLIETGLVTPPVGLNLFVIQTIAPQHKFEDIVIGVMPFFGAQLVMLVILTAFPIVATWLPSLTIR